ncbi:MAG: tetratricopeptide repeat protein [Candidatus Hydrogenedentes bacterium]|nr:tetratricopeptide repeat protein [Candidatus Hydrogenedentota bacterium]
MDSLLYGLAAQAAPTRFTGMDMFIDKQVRHDDPRMEAVYANYQRNLADIAEVALDAGAGVVLCTLGVNEGDLAPFGSLHPPGFGEEQQAAWQEYFEAGVALEEAGSWTGAIESFSQAEALDGTYAELQFRLGRCARALGRYDEAKRLFALARDLDTLRFRTDSRLNESTRTVAADMAAEGVLLTDVDRLLSEASPNGIPGSELFCDHVHFTFAGNYLIARALLEKVEQALPDSLGATGSGKRDPLTEEECAKRLALTEWDLAQQAHSLYKRVMLAPFTNRCDHDASLAELKERREALRPQLGEAGRTKAIPAYREALRAAPNDSMMRLRLGALLLKHKDPAAAEEELRHVIRRLPQEMMPRVLLSRVLTTQEDYGGAEAIWREMLKVYPNSDSAHLNLALALKRQGDMPGAIEEHGEAIAISPFRPDLHFQFGGTLAAHGDPMAAIEEYRTAIELSPTHSEARLSLGTLLIDSSRQREAIPVLRGLIEQSPSKIEAHLLLGKALWAVNRAKEALAEYREAAAIEPGNATAHQSIALILYTGKDYDGAWAAVQLCRSAGGKLDPKFIAALERDSGRAQ